VVNMRLDKGADVNAQDGVFGSTLQAAASEGNEGIVGMLFEKGTVVNSQSGLSSSALKQIDMRLTTGRTSLAALTLIVCLIPTEFR
jgi:hypothetical protein